MKLKLEVSDDYLWLVSDEGPKYKLARWDGGGWNGLGFPQLGLFLDDHLGVPE